MFYDLLEPEYTHTPAEDGWFHESDLPDLNACRDWLSAAVDAVYTTGDLTLLTDSLEELCHYLDVDFPRSSPILNPQTLETTHD